MYLKTVSKYEMQRQISNSMRWFRKKVKMEKEGIKLPYLSSWKSQENPQIKNKVKVHARPL